MKKFLITVLCFLTVCMLFACAEEPIAKPAESSSIPHGTPSELSVIPELSFEISEESVIELPSEPFDETEAENSEEQSAEQSSDENSKEESLDESSEETSFAESSEEISDELPPEESSEEEAPPAESSEEASSEETSKDEPVERPHTVNGWIVYKGRGMEPFGGTAYGGGLTAEVYNNFKERVGENVNVYAMPIPLASAFYAPEGYESSISAAVNCFGGLRDGLVNITYVDLIEALSAHTGEDIYARTDHHWNALGAYYAAQALCLAADVPFATLDSFTQNSFEGFLGSVYSSWGISELKNYPETFVWYEPTQEYTAHYYSQNYNFSFSGTLFSNSKSYVKFIYGDSYAVRVETGVQNGRKMLVIKDSFGNALAPFLISGFEEVYVVDFRDFNVNILEFIEENEITDVTLALSAFSVAGSKRNNITRLMEK
ncbi:MAG: hypothetical protein IJD82_11185 [Clostridia bacterium]|nr:hypothetical protein [Clostridia bacterium]